MSLTVWGLSLVTEPLSDRLRALLGQPRTELCVLWKQFFQVACLPELRSGLMVRVLSQRMQEQCCGELSARSRRRLHELARALEKGTISSVSGIKPGTRLVREWRGRTHVVTIEEKGYEYKGCHYESLSEIARMITGTRWSGPLFFGTRVKPIISQ
jgi:Protein of unknown function (DUF2924)